MWQVSEREERKRNRKGKKRRGRRRRKKRRKKRRRTHSQLFQRDLYFEGSSSLINKTLIMDSELHLAGRGVWGWSGRSRWRVLEAVHSLAPKRPLYTALPNSCPFGKLESLPFMLLKLSQEPSFPAHHGQQDFSVTESNEVLYPEGKKTVWGAEGLWKRSHGQPPRFRPALGGVPPICACSTSQPWPQDASGDHIFTTFYQSHHGSIQGDFCLLFCWLLLIC